MGCLQHLACAMCYYTHLHACSYEYGVSQFGQMAMLYINFDTFALASRRSAVTVLTQAYKYLRQSHHHTYTAP